jgi:MFS family permease
MALDIGVARITYGTVLPALRRDLSLSFFEAGALSAVNLAAYLLGTLIAPRLGRIASMRALARWGHAVFALGALASALAPEVLTLALGRVLTGLGAGVGLLAVFVVVFEQTRPGSRSVVSVGVWSGIGVAIVASGLAAPWLLGEPGSWRWAFGVGAILAGFVAWEVGRRPATMPRAAGALGTGPVAQALAPRSATAWLGLFGAYFMFGVGYIAYSTFMGGRLAAAQADTATIV